MNTEKFLNTAVDMDTMLRDFESSEQKETVLVTGASSFIGSHIVKLLLEQGYDVRGTVSSLIDSAVVDPLRNLVSNACYQLQLFEVDMLNEETWREPLRDCKFIVHTAAPYPDEPLFGDEIDTVDLAINAITTLLGACVKYGHRLRRFVFTSSIGAIAGDSFQDGRTYSEADWPEDFDDLQPYVKSKVVCEKYLWDFIKEKGANQQHAFELAVINPGFVLGPLLLKKTNQSLETIIDLLIKHRSLLPDLYLPVVDVRDVALAHVRALKLPEANLKRFIVTSNVESVSLKQIAKILDKEFKDYDVPTKVAPDFLIKFFSFFDKRLKMVTPALGHKAYFDNRRMYTILSIEPIELKKTVIDTGMALIEKKLVPEQ